MGHPTTIEALRRLDLEIKNIQDGLRTAGLLDTLQPLGDFRPRVCDIHRCARRARAAQAVRRHARRRHAPHRQRRDGDLRARRESPGDRADRAGSSRRTPGIGAIFTRSNTAGSSAAGRTARCRSTRHAGAHARSGDILYSPDWTDRKNAMAGLARARRMASPDTAARVRSRFTTR